MSKAEERALEAYPYKAGGYTQDDGTPYILDSNEGSRQCFIYGYQQAEKDMVERACRWLLDNYENYFDEDGRTTSTLNEFMVGDFRRAMEEE